MGSEMKDIHPISLGSQAEPAAEDETTQETARQHLTSLLVAIART